MSKSRKLLGIIGFVISGVFTLFIILGILPHSVSQKGVRIIIHLVAGFYFFLSRNIPAISFNADTWIPGLAAFLTALAIGHRFMRRWAAQGNREWSLRTSLCLGLVLPVLFVTAFIVPGILLQLELLHQIQWFATRLH